MNKDLLNFYTDDLICSTEQTTASQLSRIFDSNESQDRITHFYMINLL